MLVHHAPVRIMFFAQLRELTGADHAEVQADRIAGPELWDLLLKRWPSLSAHRATTRLARNGCYAGPDEVFMGDDEVALIPPVSGG